MESTKLGELIDRLYNHRQNRLALEKRVQEMKSEEHTLRQLVMAELDEVGLAKASGSTATVGIVESTQPQIEDWEAVHKYIREHDRFDLLQKRLSVLAWRDLVQKDGFLVPGTVATTVYDLSLTKSGR